MPAGVSWGTYVKYQAVFFASGLAGSQVIHMIFKPLQGVDEKIKEEVISKRKILKEKM